MIKSMMNFQKIFYFLINLFKVKKKNQFNQIILYIRQSQIIQITKIEKFNYKV
jgi:hypothetical protein